MRSITMHKSYCTPIHSLQLLPTTAVQHRQQVEAVGCRMFVSGPISTFVFGVLQIPSGCIQIFSGSMHPTAPPGYRPASYLTENSTSHFRRPYDYSYVAKQLRSLVILKNDMKSSVHSMDKHSRASER